MCNVTFQTFLLLMNTIIMKAKILKNQNVDISNISTDQNSLKWQPFAFSSPWSLSLGCI